MRRFFVVLLGLVLALATLAAPVALAAPAGPVSFKNLLKQTAPFEAVGQAEARLKCILAAWADLAPGPTQARSAQLELAALAPAACPAVTRTEVRLKCVQRWPGRSRR